LDVKKRFSEEQVTALLREADKGVAVKELCRKHGFPEPHIVYAAARRCISEHRSVGTHSRSA
jgi:transposase-like protein